MKRRVAKNSRKRRGKKSDELHAATNSELASSGDYKRAARSARVHIRGSRPSLLANFFSHKPFSFLFLKFNDKWSTFFFVQRSTFFLKDEFFLIFFWSWRHWVDFFFWLIFWEFLVSELADIVFLADFHVCVALSSL